MLYSFINLSILIQMMPMHEVHVLDSNAAALGVPTEILMENAGKGIADLVIERLKPKKGRKPTNILIVCGTGNNGGDGLVAARYLRTKSKVTILMMGEPKTRLSKKNFKPVQKLVKSDVENIEKYVDQAHVIIDAMLGVGITRELKEDYAKVVDAINDAKDAKVISVDLPTGLGGTKAIKPDFTVTFHDLKHGMSPSTCGEIVTVDIGIPADAVTYTGPGELTMIPAPGKNIHKGDRGKLLIVGGGPYYGAPILAALAAHACGCDLLYIGVPSVVFNAVAAHSPDFIILPLEGNQLKLSHVSLLAPLIDKSDAMVIGPGLGRGTSTAVEAVIKHCKVPIIVDADALVAIAGNKDIVHGKKIVLTPHRGEFERLSGSSLPEDIAEWKEIVMQKARDLEATILLKAPVDIISDGDRLKLNRTGNPAMVTGGTGDVLSGITGAMLAKGIAPFDAARIAAYLCGKAGDKAFKELGHSLRAQDIVRYLPEVLGEELDWWRP
jgi:NAD(P)H-hydrate epimerase